MRAHMCVFEELCKGRLLFPLTPLGNNHNTVSCTALLVSETRPKRGKMNHTEKAAVSGAEEDNKLAI